MLTMQQLRATGNRPRVHGNGFIQLDLTEEKRLHIWGHPDIPRQVTRSPIHDHIFSFTSTALVGRLTNVIYQEQVHPDGNWRVHVPQIRRGEDSILVPTDETCFVVPSSVDVIDARAPMMLNGHSQREYYMPAYKFHETLTDGPAATLITKEGRTQAQGGEGLPRVLVDVSDNPDNEFDRYDCADPETLWRIIEEVLYLR